MPSPKEVIFDPRDDRKRIADTGIPPFTGICLLNALDASAQTRLAGTGWCVRNDALVTAAHVVFKPEIFGGAGVAPRVLAWPGYNAPDRITTSLEVARITVHPVYQQTLARDFDFAILKLSAPIPQAARFGIEVLSDAELMSRTVSLTGYPHDKGGVSLWHANGPIRFVEAQRLFHQVDADEGQSGSPLWFADAGEFKVVGVHVHGTSLSGHLGFVANVAARLTQPVAHWIHSSLSA